MPSLHVEDVAFLKTMTIRYFELLNDVYPWSECIPNTSVECIVIEWLQSDKSISRMMHWTIGDPNPSEGMLEVLPTNLSQLISTFLGLRSLRFSIPCQIADSIFQGEDFDRIWEKWLEKCDALMIVLEVSQGSEEISADEYRVVDPRSLHRKLVCD